LQEVVFKYEGVVKFLTDAETSFLEGEVGNTEGSAEVEERVSE
jgi:hypothetical protein